MNTSDDNVYIKELEKRLGHASKLLDEAAAEKKSIIDGVNSVLEHLPDSILKDRLKIALMPLSAFTKMECTKNEP